MDNQSIPWQALVEAAPEGTVILDAEGAVRYANPAALALLGLAPPAGQPIEDWLADLGANMREALLEAIEKASQVRFYDPDAEQKFLLFAADPLPGQGAGMLVRVQRDYEVEASDLIAITAHELRIPMTSIMGYAKMLLTVGAESLNDMQRQFVDTINRNVERLNVELVAVQDMTRVDRGRIRLELEPQRVTGVLREVLAEFDELVEEKGHQVDLSGVLDGLPAVRADSNRFKQILRILLDNALRYTPPGGRIVVSVHLVGGSVQIDVADNGPGIPQLEQPKIFSRFFRGEDDAIREHPGLGLGLYIAKGLTELQGGEFGFETEEGAGSTFRFSLPVWE
jgi:signal transduction histidine kinase